MVVLIDCKEEILVCANIGDSHAVVSRNGAAHVLSFSHKPFKPTEKTRIQDAGHTITNGRIDGSLAISRAFGDVRFKVDLPFDWDNEPSRSPGARACSCVPHISSLVLDAESGHDMVYLVCDGVTDVMCHEEAVGWVRRKFELKPPPRRTEQVSGDAAVTVCKREFCELKFTKIAENFCEYALRKGSKDNVSAIILLLESPS